VLVVKDGADAPLERFVFSLRTMLDIEPYQKDDPCAPSSTSLPSLLSHTA
jgi:hypothetical protein